MSASIRSLIDSGTKLWLDSVDPGLTTLNRDLGITGATSNPIIIADLIKSGRYNDKLKSLSTIHSSPDDVTWALTDDLVAMAEKVFFPVFEKTKGDDGYVSFEVDPLLEDSSCNLNLQDKAERYLSLAKKWHRGHPNRMIKVPATPAGLLALEAIVAAEIPLNVTLIFTEAQYMKARDAVWRGAKRLNSLAKFKSVFSIFVSRIDIYCDTHYRDLDVTRQGLVGILNARRIWQMNQSFWADKSTPLRQEMIFASTGTKKPADLPWKYVQALAGSDIQTNPPATNEATAKSGVMFSKTISQRFDEKLERECTHSIDWLKLETDLMREGLAKFADPQKALIQTVTAQIKGV